MAPQFDKPLRDLLRAAGCMLMAAECTSASRKTWMAGSSPATTESECGVCTNKNGRVFRPGRFKLNPPMFR